MSVYPSGFEPFNQGLFKNLKKAFFHQGKLEDWKLPNICEVHEKR
jgi:hypothetical protein